MPTTVNTNVMSLNAQRNLTRSDGMLQTALQRLSSGLRINSAKDDAAGMAIAQRFTTQIRGLNQAVRNASDGISLSQTAESALDELTNNLQRIRELAVQSANVTNSASDRAALDAEVQQRIAEIDRIAVQTSFNGVNVLDGTFGSATFQVGANIGDTISVSLSVGVRSGQIGSTAAITETGTFGAVDPVTGEDLLAADAVVDFTVGDPAGTPTTLTFLTGSSRQDVVDQVNAANIEGLSAFIDDAGLVQFIAEDDLTLAGAGIAGIGHVAATTAVDTTGLDSLAVATVDGANLALAKIDVALVTVNALRGDLGAVQNRFESTIVNLQTVSENLSASRGRIMDADFAAETANLTKAQILQQAGVAVLAQANAVPQTVLGLLQ
jgi:flagellin